MFVNILTFTNTYDTIRTDKRQGDKNMDSRTYYYARVSSKEQEKEIAYLEKTKAQNDMQRQAMAQSWNK